MLPTVSKLVRLCQAHMVCASSNRAFSAETCSQGAIISRPSGHVDSPLLRNRLCSWMRSARVTRFAVNELLEALHSDHLELLLDYRPLLKTPPASNLNKLACGSYPYTELQPCILRVLCEESGVISQPLHLQLHTNRLSLHMSISIQLWPIQGRFRTPGLEKPPSVVRPAVVHDVPDVTQYVNFSDLLISILHFMSPCFM
ncbi:hypothetical protein AHF37_11137 [Paragonimus kellicotti]|nr:hypothetical protein AHF37_11137 [Paragonimus kellicotti]